MWYKTVSILFFVILTSCAKKDVQIEEELSIEFEKAMKYSEKNS